MITFVTISSILALSTVSMAQLLGCDQIGCPSGSNPFQAVCALGNLTATQIGVAEVNTSLSQQPLTWTLGFSNVNEQVYRKDFYLGQPASVLLQSNNSVAGCAIFLEGISGSLHFHNVTGTTAIGEDNGSCEEALTTGCANALQSRIANLAASTGLSDGSVSCQNLATMLSADVPPACSMYENIWSNISSRAISGPNMAAPIQLADCHPTISKDYTLTQVEGFEAQFPQGQMTAELIQFMGGITPVFTVFGPGSSESTSSVDGKGGITSETHLSCLKYIAASENSGDTGGQATSSATNTTPGQLGFAALLTLMMFTWSL